jgi:hypothetical protein
LYGYWNKFEKREDNMCSLEIQYSVENYGFQTILFGVDKNSILEKKH